MSELGVIIPARCHRYRRRRSHSETDIDRNIFRIVPIKMSNQGQRLGAYDRVKQRVPCSIRMNKNTIGDSAKTPPCSVTALNERPKLFYELIYAWKSGNLTVSSVRHYLFSRSAVHIRQRSERSARIRC